MSRLVSILTIEFQPQKDITAYELHEAYSLLTPLPAMQDQSRAVIHSDKWSKLDEELRRHFTVLKVEHKMELSEEEKQQEEREARLRAKKIEVETVMNLQAVKGQIVAASGRNVSEAELRMLQEQMELAYKRRLEEGAKKAKEVDSKVWTGR